MGVEKNIFQGMLIFGFASVVGVWSYSVNPSISQFKYLRSCAPLIVKERTGFQEACIDSTGPADRVLELIVKTRDEKLRKANCDYFCEQWDCEKDEDNYSAHFERYECQSLLESN